MCVKIIVDSTADLKTEVRQRVGIVPLTVHFGDEEYLDGITITHREFYEKLIESDVLPTTSQASPAVFQEAFEAATKAGKSVVVLTVSSELSGTYQSAVIAAADYDNVYVVDTRTVAIGAGILTERALELADAGMDAEAIAQALTRERENVRVIAMLDTLEYLKRAAGSQKPQPSLEGS